MSKYVPAEFKKAAFHCPHCSVFANQDWSNTGSYYNAAQPKAIFHATCAHCGLITIWRRNIENNDVYIATMLYPSHSIAPPPHEDMPKELAQDFEEARSILAPSPRGAAALLRLVIQKLANQLTGVEDDINKNIGILVQQGLPPIIQQALDSVRVIGNEAVHPGTIDLNDTPETAARLFELVNLIVQDRITHPKQVAALYASLPANKLKGIADRDKPKPPKSK